MPWMVTLLSVGLIGVPHEVQMGCSMTPLVSASGHAPPVDQGPIPLQWPGHAGESRLDAGEVQSYLRRVERVISLRRGTDRCRVCGTLTEVCSMLRPE